jgi:hypothetical protein
MFGYNNNYFNTNFLNSLNTAINESLTKAQNRSGIGLPANQIMEQQTTSGRQTGIGPGKTLMQPDKTWDEIAREEAGKSRAFKGKDLSGVKFERKDGKVYADGIELTTASIKTSHYDSDAPTRSGMSAPKTAPAAPAVTSGTGKREMSSRQFDVTGNFVRGMTDMAKGAKPAPAPDRTEVPKAVELKPGDIRPQGTPTANPPKAATPPLAVKATDASPAATAEFEKASRTPAALKQADKRIEAAGDDTKASAPLTNPISGTVKNFSDFMSRLYSGDWGRASEKNAPGVVPVRPEKPGSATAPRTASGAQVSSVGGSHAETLSKSTEMPPGFQRGTSGRSLAERGKTKATADSIFGLGGSTSAPAGPKSTQVKKPTTLPYTSGGSPI